MMSTEKQIHKTAIRLLEGGREFFDGHWYKAMIVSGDIIPCEQCELDSLCNMQVVDLCGELEAITKKRCMLKLADGKLK